MLGHLTPPEAARRLGVSVRTLYRLAQRDEGPPYIQVTARRRRYRSADIEEWEEASRRGGASPRGNRR